MIPLERITTRLSAAISLKDDLSPDKKVIGNVSLSVLGRIKPPLKHSLGYYLLIDHAEGKHNITVGGDFYKEQTFVIDTNALNPKMPIAELSLNPNAKYPFPEGLTILKGKILDLNGKPIPQATITIRAMTENAVSEDDGSFFILFKKITADKKITVNVKKGGFKPKRVTLLLAKGKTTFSEIGLSPQI